MQPTLKLPKYIIRKAECSNIIPFDDISNKVLPHNSNYIVDVFMSIFFYGYIITYIFKQHKNTITRYIHIGSTWENLKKKFLIKKLTKNN